MAVSKIELHLAGAVLIVKRRSEPSLSVVIRRVGLRDNYLQEVELMSVEEISAIYQAFRLLVEGKI